MKDQLKEILSKQRYDQLSLDEKETLNALCLDDNNPEVIGNIFHILDGLNANSTVQPRNQTKERLDYLFHNNTKSRGSSYSLAALSAFFFPPAKPLWQTPLVPIAAAVVILFISVRFWTEEINGSNAVGLKTAQLSDSDLNRFPKKNQTQVTQPSTNLTVNKSVKRAHTSPGINTISFVEDMRIDAYTSVGSYASSGSGSLAMGAEETAADKEKYVSFRLTDCIECVDLITASY